MKLSLTAPNTPNYILSLKEGGRITLCQTHYFSHQPSAEFVSFTSKRVCEVCFPE